MCTTDHGHSTHCVPPQNRAHRRIGTPAAKGFAVLLGHDATGYLLASRFRDSAKQVRKDMPGDPHGEKCEKFDTPKSGFVIMTKSGNGEGIFKYLLDGVLRDTYTPIEWEGYTPYDQLPPRTPLPRHQAVQVSPAVLDRYVGSYSEAPKLVLTIRREGDHLSIQENDDQSRNYCRRAKPSSFPPWPMTFTSLRWMDRVTQYGWCYTRTARTYPSTRSTHRDDMGQHHCRQQITLIYSRTGPPFPP